MMIISNVCHISVTYPSPNIGDHRGLLGHSFICVAVDILTMQNNFFHSLNIGNIARIANNAFNKKLFSLLRPTFTTPDGGLLAGWKLWACE